MKNFKYAYLTTVLGTTIINGSMAMEEPVQIQDDVGARYSTAVRGKLQTNKELIDLFTYEQVPTAEKFVRLAIEMILESLRLQEMQNQGVTVKAETALNAGQNMFADLVDQSLKTPVRYLQKSDYNEVTKTNPSNNWLDNELKETAEYKFVDEELQNLFTKNSNVDDYNFEEDKSNVGFYSNRVPLRVVLNCNGYRVVGDPKLFYWSFWKKAENNQNCQELMTKLLEFEQTYCPPEKPYVPHVEKPKIVSFDEELEKTANNKMPAQKTEQQLQSEKEYNLKAKYKKFLNDGIFENKETALDGIIELIGCFGWDFLKDQYWLDLKKDSLGNIHIFKRCYRETGYNKLNVNELTELERIKGTEGVSLSVEYIPVRLVINQQKLIKKINTLIENNPYALEKFKTKIEKMPDMNKLEREQLYRSCDRGLQSSAHMESTFATIKTDESKTETFDGFEIQRGRKETELNSFEEIFGKSKSFEKVDLKKCEEKVNYKVIKDIDGNNQLELKCFRFEPLQPNISIVPPNIKNVEGAITKELYNEKNKVRSCLVKGITWLDAIGLKKTNDGYKSVYNAGLNDEDYRIAELTEVRSIPLTILLDKNNTKHSVSTDLEKIKEKIETKFIDLNDKIMEQLSVLESSAKVLDGSDWITYNKIPEQDLN